MTKLPGAINVRSYVFSGVVALFSVSAVMLYLFIYLFI